MKEKIIEILGVCIEPELAELKAKQIIDLFQKNKPTQNQINDIVEIIAWDQFEEEPADDFDERIWRFKQFLKKHYE